MKQSKRSLRFSRRKEISVRCVNFLITKPAYKVITKTSAEKPVGQAEQAQLNRCTGSPEKVLLESPFRDPADWWALSFHFWEQ